MKRYVLTILIVIGVCFAATDYCMGCPVADIDAPDEVCKNHTVKFDGSDSYDQDDEGSSPEITDYDWTYPGSATLVSGGDGSDYVKLKFTSTGTETVELEVTDNEGLTAETDFDVDVDDPNTWSTSTVVSVSMDDEIKGKVNDAINAIPGVSGISVTEGSFTCTTKSRECCEDSGDDIGEIKGQKCSDGTLTLSATIGGVTLYGGTFTRQVSFGGGNWGASIDLIANITLGGAVNANAKAGKFWDECDTDCVYASASLACTRTATGTVNGTACVRVWGTDWCVSSPSATGSASISWTGTVRKNQCGDCDGINGSISLDTIILSGSVTVPGWSGSYTYTIYDAGA